MKPSGTWSTALVIAMLMTGPEAHPSTSVSSAWSGKKPHAIDPHVILAQQSQQDQQKFIRGIQEDLQALGLYDGQLDGIWGDQSRWGLGEFIRIGAYGSSPDSREVMRHLNLATIILRQTGSSYRFAIQKASLLADASDAAAKGREFSSEGKFSDAVRFLGRAVELEEAVFGIGHPSTFVGLEELGLALRGNGEFNAAVAVQQRVVDGRKRKQGENHPDVLTSLNNLALILSAKGRYADAESINRHLLSARKKLLGPESLDTLVSMNNLAANIRNQGRYAEAEALDRRTFEGFEHILGPEHPNTLASLGNLALSISAQGRHADAEPLHRRVLEACERILGPEHPDTLTSLNNLAASLHDQGRYTDAEALHRRTLEGRERILGREHPATLNSLNNLANSLREQDRYAEAEVLDRRTLEGFEQVLGPEHPDTLNSLNNLAISLSAQGRHAEAEPLHRRVLEARESILGPEHPSTLNSLNNLTTSILDQGRHAEAEALYRQVLQAQERVFGPEHPATLNSQNNLAESIRRRGRHGEAEAVFRRTLDVSERALGAEHPHTLVTRDNLARTYLELDFVQALATWEAGFPALPGYLAATGRLEGGGDAGSRTPLDLERYLATLADADFDAQEKAPRSFPVQGFLTYSALDVALGDQAARGALTENDAATALRDLQDAREALDQRRRAYLASFEDESRAGAHEALAQGIREAEARLAAATALIKRDFPALAELELPQPLSADEAQALLRPGEGLVAFAATEETLYAWFATQETISWQAIDISREELARRVAHLRAAVDLEASAPESVPGECALRGSQSWPSDRPFDLCAARQLYDLLLSGFDLTGVSELIVVADDPLQQIPFSLLVSGELGDGTPQWLVEERAIVSLPTTSSLRALRRDARASASDDRLPFLGFAPVTFDGSGEGSPLRATLVDLPATGDEVRFLAGVLGAGPEGAVLGDAATEAKVKSANLDKYRVISFATHGLLSREAEEVTGGAVREPALVLRAGGNEDGLLTASEVATLRLDADWVLLSACNTAAGSGEDARGFSGLARAFFFAGARSLLVSHWSVDDNAAMELMSATLSRATEAPEYGKAQALRQAQLAVMSNPDHAHPLFWAPFDLVGESR